MSVPDSTNGWAGGGLAVIVLAGGRARRLGGATKPAQAVGGVPLLVRVLAATDSALARVVVGPEQLAGILPAGVVRTSEEPPGSGPVAAIAAGLEALPGRPGLVAVLGADLPFLGASTVQTLRTALANEPDRADAVVLADDSGRPQWMCGVWRVAALRERLAALARTVTDTPAFPAFAVRTERARSDSPGGLIGRGMRELAAGLRVARVPADATAPPPWFDCDTEDDLRRAEEWMHDGAG